MITLILVAAAALNCADPQTNAEIGQCAVADYKRADAALNRQWTVTMARVKSRDHSLDRMTDKAPGYTAQLLASQRAWLKYRDAECVSEGNVMRGGSGQPSLIIACKTELTNQRTKELRSLAENL